MAEHIMDAFRLKGIDPQNPDDIFTLPRTNVDSTLSQEGDAADAKVVGDEIAGLKEDLGTLQTEGTVPTSEQMLSDNVTVDSVPYHFRRTASDNADREELEIVGGSVAWNQNVVGGNFADATAWGITNASTTIDSVASNVLTMTCSAANSGIRQVEANVYTFLNGHKYLKTADVKSSCTVRFDIDGEFTKTSNGSGNWETLASVFNWGYNSNPFRLYIRLQSNATVFGEVQVKNVMLFDLTQMFGSTIADHIYSLEQTTAGAGVALFRSLFNKDYYPYDAGSMQSVSGLSEHRTVGFNQWDEQWKYGKYNNDTGLPDDTVSSVIRNVNSIKIIPNAQYYVKTPVTSRFFEYDANHNYLRTYTSGSGEIQMSENAHYLNLQITASAFVENYICINLSDPAKNGTYEPYDGHSYALDDSLTLRGIPTLVDGKIKFDGDIYSPSGKVTRRYGIVDLGTVVWNDSSDYFYSSLGLKRAGNFNLMCSRYPTTTATSVTTMNDKEIKGHAANNAIYIKDSSYSSGADLKASLSGVYCVIELVTPITENADPYVSPQICHANGTEEFVSTGIVPVGHVTKYPDNLRKKLDNLPWNFASLIAPTESGFTATRNYTTGQLLIVNNVLYKATANIANGATITVGTNVTATTLAEVIAALS